MAKKQLIGKVVRIISDNENYTEFLDKELVIVESYFEEGKDEEPIYDLVNRTDNKVFPFSLYEWEFEVI